MAMGLGANGLNLYPYGTIAAHWNVAVRVLAVLSIIGFLRWMRRSYEREWRLARTDPLTGALNRQAFFELAGAIHHSPAWDLIAYADLDGLKRLNDQHGHIVGDRCLKAYAKHVRASIRKDDIFVRLGGDEFLIYMSMRDEAAAKAVAARLHRGMNTIAAQMDAKLGCSLGVLILPPGQRAVERELKLADELMYEAKQRGAALMAATAHERRGTFYIGRHWELVHSYADPAQAGAERLPPARDTVVVELPAVPLPRQKRSSKGSSYGDAA
jgi:diguanylate cyclase (GGDEF)-like protein